ncbi:MAG TPA: tetratricopeptide repeat protein, partial [Thermoanaerobaculia bacterium]|nr:tetratricopeptide repeat protein [Thermoanaerobaculia bacterium]
PRDPAPLLELGAALAARGDAPGALAAWRRAIELDGDPAAAAAAHVQSAQLLAGRGEEAAAVDHLRSAVAVAPEHRLAHFNLATLLAARGAYEEAARGYSRVLELDATDRDAHLGRAQALAAAGRLAEARAALAEGLRRLPGDALLTAALSRLGAER